MAGFLTWVSIKLRRTPRLHSLLLFRQLLQSGKPSSHLRWRSRHVKHPVRTRRDFPAAAPAGGAADLMLPWPSLDCPRSGTDPARTDFISMDLVGTCRLVVTLGGPESFCRFGGESSKVSLGLRLLVGVVV